MVNSKRKANNIFLQICAISLFLFVAFLALGTILFNRLVLIWASLTQKLEAICGCTNHFSFYNHPWLFSFLFLAGLGMLAFFSFAIIRMIQLKYSTNRFIKVNLRSKRKIFTKKLRKATETLKLENKVIEINDSSPVIFCFGFWRPKICISSLFVRSLKTEELIAVLLHEQHHLKVHEPARVYFVKTVTRVLFFLPLLKSLAKQYFIFSELAADDWAISKSRAKTPLAQAVYKALEWKESTKESTVASNLAVSSFSNITEERINKITDDKYALNIKVFTPKLLISTFLAALLIIAFGFFINSSDTAVAGYSEHACSFQGHMNMDGQCQMAFDSSSCQTDFIHELPGSSVCGMEAGEELMGRE